MELRHLRYFTETAKELHFAKAAEKLKLTQPALSRQIAALEQELGVELFNRSNKWKIVLTEAGSMFLMEAEKILHETDRAVHLAKSAAKGGYGKLAIGAISSTIESPEFSQALQEMRARYPDLLLEVLDATSGGLPELVRQHALDIAFLRPLPELAGDETLIYEHLWNDKLVAAIPHDHPLARQVQFLPGALANEAFIMVPEKTSSSQRQYLINFFHKYGGFMPKVEIEIYNTYTALRMVAAHLGVSVVAESYMGHFTDRICYRFFTANPPEMPLCVIRATDHTSKSAETFLKILKKHHRN